MRKLLIVAGIAVALIGPVIVYVDSTRSAEGIRLALNAGPRLRGSTADTGILRKPLLDKLAALRAQSRTRCAIIVGTGALLVVVGVAWPRGEN